MNSQPGSNEALCLEILGNLRRCLMQQADVRLSLYEVKEIYFHFLVIEIFLFPF